MFVPVTSSALALPLDLPAWVVPATPSLSLTTLGINRDGDLYIYGDTAANPGPIVPAVRGCVASIATSTHGAGSRYGPREYLDLTMAAATPGTGFLLRLPCGATNPISGTWSNSWAVRSLLGALQEVDLSFTAVKLQTKRGREATFLQVYPHDPEGRELPEVRATSIGGSRDDLEIAINRVRAALGQPALFDELTAVADTMETTSYSPDDF
jgi:hypothetical protein